MWACYYKNQEIAILLIKTKKSNHMFINDFHINALILAC